MAHPTITDFLHRFTALRSKVNNNPRNITWMAAQSSDVQALTIVTYCAWLGFRRFAATVPGKAIDRVPKGFKAQLRDYEADWADTIGEVVGKAIAKSVEEIDEIPEAPSEEEQESDRPNFDPRWENAAQLVEDLLWLSDTHAQFDDDIADQQRKALQAWDWFRDTAGLDLKAVAHRWKEIEPILVPDHVANAYGASDPSSLYEMLNQAVRAYVYGASAAAIAMCRTLTDLVLTRHYGCQGEDLEQVIIFAEKQPKNLWVKRLALQDKRRLANQVLHEYREVEDKAVVDWLTTLKELIERVPDKGS